MRCLRACQLIPGRLYQRGRFVKYSKEQKADLLRRYGIKVVVNLCGVMDGDLFARPEDLLYIRWHIVDSRLPNVVLLTELANLLSQFVQEGRTVLVHCKRGRDRSSLLNALVVGAVCGMSGKEAVKYVRERRPNALGNPHFVKYLEQLP